MATTKAAAPATVDVAKQLKAAVGVFASSQKELARKDKTISKLTAQIAKLEAKKNGGVAPAVKRGRKASADDADAPVAKRVKAAAVPAAVETKKRGPKAAAQAPVAATEPKKRGPKPKAAAVAAPVPTAKTKAAIKESRAKATAVAAAPAKKSRTKSDEDFLV